MPGKYFQKGTSVLSAKANLIVMLLKSSKPFTKHELKPHSVWVDENLADT